MAITLDAVDLSNDLVWADRYTWTPVVQSTSTAIDGSLIVEAGAKIKGRKISLVGENNVGWMRRTDIEALYAKSIQPGLQMTLTFKGTAMTVIFDHEKGAIDVDQAMGYSDPAGDDWIRVKSLNFIQV